MTTRKGLHHLRLSSASDDRKERQGRARELRLAASGMRYFGDYAEAAEMEAEADRLEETR